MPKINQKVVSNTSIDIPTTDKQLEIVRILDDLLSKERQAKDVAEAILQQIDLIKKIILSRAFRGELGTNNLSEERSTGLPKAII